VGDSFVDIVAGTIDQMPKFGGDATVERITQYPGGSALNVAVGMGEIFGTYVFLLYPVNILLRPNLRNPS
jgi:sugar/nucleoside kinase (ribokinase family)